MSLVPVLVVSPDSTWASELSAPRTAPSFGVEDDGAELVAALLVAALLVADQLELGAADDPEVDALDVDDPEADALEVDELKVVAVGGIVAQPTTSATTPAAATAPPMRRLTTKAQPARPATAANTRSSSADRPSITRPPDSPPPISPNRHSRITVASPTIFRTPRFRIASTSSNGRRPRHLEGRTELRFPRDRGGISYKG